jgi:hypothetical protein
MRFLHFIFLCFFFNALHADIIESDPRVLTEILIKEVVTQVLKDESTIEYPNSGFPVVIDPAVSRGEFSQCWLSWVYNSDGKKTPHIDCY